MQSDADIALALAESGTVIYDTAGESF
jgi:hypothetical protein